MIKELIKKIKNRFGLFFRKNKRVYSPFFEVNCFNYISGHKGLELFVGNYAVHFIYRF